MPGIEQLFLKFLNPGPGGHDIAWLPLAYAAAVLGFLLALGIALLLIRLLAHLIIFAGVIGGIACLCYFLSSGSVRTWEQLAVAILLLGGAVAVPCATARLYTLKDQGSG